VLLLRRSTRMASILNLVRPEAAFDPDTIALCARFVARRIIDMAQRGIRDQKELADGAVRFSCCELST
jgi:hypothetical protein